MEISKEEFENIANLSALSPGKVNQNLKSDLEKIISRFESLKQIDTNGINPTAHVTNLENSLREDKSDKVLDSENILMNAPETNAGQIKIPRVFINLMSIISRAKHIIEIRSAIFQYSFPVSCSWIIFFRLEVLVETIDMFSILFVEMNS